MSKKLSRITPLTPILILGVSDLEMSTPHWCFEFDKDYRQAMLDFKKQTRRDNPQTTVTNLRETTLEGLGINLTHFQRYKQLRNAVTDVLMTPPYTDIWA